MSVATRSPAPTPVAATTMPGPMYFQLDLRGMVLSMPDGASVCVEFPVGGPVVSAMEVKKTQRGRSGKGACGISTRCAHTPVKPGIPADRRGRG